MVKSLVDVEVSNGAERWSGKNRSGDEFEVMVVVLDSRCRCGNGSCGLWIWGGSCDFNGVEGGRVGWWEVATS